MDENERFSCENKKVDNYCPKQIESINNLKHSISQKAKLLKSLL